ncbi:MAG: hypothetical protein EXQ52_11320 [Bryobacterales bacterium]|nr:hypothetical protein [Bryobacterales bacterium]
MKFAAVLLLLITALARAQFGNVLNRAKERVDKAREQAKPVATRAERAATTFQPWSAVDEEKIGHATAAKMIAMFGLVDNPGLARYVNLVGQSVAQFAARQVAYRFGILDSPIVGAYALPGGFIFITRGALEGMSTEAELAGALGHEVIHVAERHLEREVRARNTSSWATEEASARAGTQSSIIRDALIKDLFNTKLSRDKEDGADRDGSSLATQAGYAGTGLLEFLKTLEAANSKQENSQAFGQLLTTHPPFAERIARLAAVSERSPGGVTLAARFEAAMAAAR